MSSNNSGFIRGAVILLGLVTFVLLLFADRKALVNNQDSPQGEASASTAASFFPSGLSIQDPAFLKEAELLATLQDKAEQKAQWLKLAGMASDSMLYSWCLAAAAELGEDTAELETAAKVLSAYRFLPDTALSARFRNKELSIREKQVVLNPASEEYRTEMALLLIEAEGRSMEGILALRKISEENPENTRVQYMLGEFSLRTGQWAKAIDRFKNVLSKNPGQGNALSGMARAYSGLGKNSEAAEYARKALQDVSLDDQNKAQMNELLHF